MNLNKLLWIVYSVTAAFLLLNWLNVIILQRSDFLEITDQAMEIKFPKETKNNLLWHNVNCFKLKVIFLTVSIAITIVDVKVFKLFILSDLI